MLVITAKRIFDGNHFLKNHHLVVDNHKIKRVASNSSLTRAGKKSWINYGNQTIVPGFIDVHVNGGGGVLFNQKVKETTLSTMVKAHARHGTVGMLPTFITDTLPNTYRALQLVRKTVSDKKVLGILGIHLEGPFISKKRLGTHSLKLVQKPSKEKLKPLLTNYANDVKNNFAKLITLAPELFSASQLNALSKAGYVVFTGHTAANYRELEQRSNNIVGFTHYFNAMGGLSARDPKSVVYTLARALDVDSRLNKNSLPWLSLIIDYAHIHPTVIKILLKIYPKERLLLITDAMSLLETDKKSFQLQSKKITRKGKFLLDNKGILSGSNLSMIEAVENTINLNSDILAIEDILKMASYQPAQMLGINKGTEKYGCLKIGYQASLTVIKGLPNLKKSRSTKPCELSITATMINGKWVYIKKDEPINYSTNKPAACCLPYS